MNGNSQTVPRLALTGLLLMTLILAPGCASVPMATKEEDASAKQFQTVGDLSRIYLYRNESMGAAVSMDVKLDGRLMGSTAAKTYFAWDVKPGPHTIISYAENDDTLSVVTESGKIYFVWQEVKWGLLKARNRLHLMDDSTGRSGVLECERAQSAK